jgi:hypothetical protein
MTEAEQEAIKAASRAMDRPKPTGRYENVTGRTTRRNSTMTSMKLGCHPDQVQEFREDARANGFTAIDFNSEGDCILPAFGDQRKKYAEFRGMPECQGRGGY